MTDHYIVRRLALENAFSKKEAVNAAIARLSAINHPVMMRISKTYFDYDGVTVKIAVPYDMNFRKLLENPAKHDNEEDTSATFVATLQMAIQLVDLVRICHSQGIFHGHIKPDDIYFNDAELKSVTLLGFEKSIFGPMSQDIGLRDLPFAPPECLGYLTMENRAAIDLYAIGAIMHARFFSKEPFQSENKEQLCRNILNVLPMATKKIDRAFAPFCKIIEKLLRKNPQERYGSADGLYYDLIKCQTSFEKSRIIAPFALGKHDPCRELNFNISTVGRENILERLEAALDSTMNGHGRLMTLGAVSGIGKTRIAKEMLKLARDRGMHVYEAKFTQYEHNIPLGAMSKIFRDFENTLSNSSRAEYDMWQKRLLTDLDPNGSLLKSRFPYLEKHFPKFAELPPLPHDLEVKLVHETIGKFITDLTIEKKGTIIFLDDMQWADETSIRFLRENVSLTSRGEMKKTLILCAYRSEELPREHKFHRLVLSNLGAENTIMLDPLDRSQSDRLIELLLDEKSPEVDKIKEIAFALTLGNPFHIYTYLHAILENGIFRLDKDNNYHFDVQASKNHSVDQKVADLVKDRIRSLSDEAFLLIVTISVAGNSIPAAAVGALLSVTGDQKADDDTSSAMKRQSIDRILDDLVKKNLLVLNDQDEVHFVHDRIRDAAWSFCSEIRRRELHRAYLEYLLLISKSFEDLEDKMMFEMAFHHQNGDPLPDHNISRRILFGAGKRASALFLYTKAKALLRDANNYLPPNVREMRDSPLFAEWFTINELLADAMSMSTEMVDAIALYKELFELTEERSEVASRICGKISRVYLWITYYPESVDWGKKALKHLGVKFYSSYLVTFLLALFFWLPHAL
ncbi:MAG: AAA family ATPase [Oligoflexales bacterium]|nr:AAA family ATPase [Oligoflexales bacterium]